MIEARNKQAGLDYCTLVFPRKSLVHLPVGAPRHALCLSAFYEEEEFIENTVFALQPYLEYRQIAVEFPGVDLLAILGPFNAFGLNKAFVDRITQRFADQRIFAQIGQGLA